jgi:hypothetical protein
MSVTAGVVDINLLAAIMTMINMTAHRFGSALLDVVYCFFMRSKHCPREALQVQWPELTHYVSQFDFHNRCTQVGSVMNFSMA